MRMLLPLLALAVVGCAEPVQCDDVRDLATSPAGLVLTEDEHPGWGSDSCAQCHHLAVIHQADCIAAADIDVQAINDEIDLQDARTCEPCHGTNGGGP